MKQEADEPGNVCSVCRMAAAERADEQLKASDRLGWVRRMNSIRQLAGKMVLTKLVSG